MNDADWDRLPIKQKRDLFLKQAEWSVFQALEHGIEVDARSIIALIRVRKSMACYQEDTPDIFEQLAERENAYNAYIEMCANEHGQNLFGKLYGSRVAWMCWSAIGDVCWDDEPEKDFEATHFFLHSASARKSSQ